MRAWLRRNPIVDLLGAVVVGSVLLAGVLLATGTRPGSVEAPIGRGIVNHAGQDSTATEKFQLAGDFRVDWSATDTGSTGVGCFHAANLDPGFAEAGTGSPEGGQTISGTTHIYGLAPGLYYLTINSGCRWTITLSPE
jgi:hypothetical protein